MDISAVEKASRGREKNNPWPAPAPWALKGKYRRVFESYLNLGPHAGTPCGVGEFDWPAATAADP